MNVRAAVSALVIAVGLAGATIGTAGSARADSDDWRWRRREQAYEWRREQALREQELAREREYARERAWRDAHPYGYPYGYPYGSPYGYRYGSPYGYYYNEEPNRSDGFWR